MFPHPVRMSRSLAFTLVPTLSRKRERGHRAPTGRGGGRSRRSRFAGGRACNGKPPQVAYFGGTPLKRQRQAVLIDRQPQRYRTDRNELIKRLLADECEMCGSTVDVEVHHVRALRDLNVKGQQEKPKWVQFMATRKRKTLVVCRTCHMDIHHGRSNPRKQQ